MKILLIDDEPNIRQMMRFTLEPAGYQVDEAGDGQTGIDRFTTSDYDVVVLDQKMPGLDGLETLRRIKAHTPEACVLMVTAFGSIELAVDAMRLGATDFLRKPMTPDMLRGAVAAAIGNTASRRPVSRREASRLDAPLPIAVLTLNGFQILGAADTERPDASAHTFRVRHIDDNVEAQVTVAIDPEAVERVARLTRRRLEPGGAFWRLQAERLVSAFVWCEGHPPPDGRLVVRDVSDEDLDAAARWNES
jgi:DNA-binding response OmpR family regulator